MSSLLPFPTNETIPALGNPASRIVSGRSDQRKMLREIPRRGNEFIFLRGARERSDGFPTAVIFSADSSMKCNVAEKR